MIIEKQLTKNCSTFEFYNTFVNEVLVPLSNANIISQLTYPETINDAKAMKDGNIIGIANNTFENYITFKFFNNIVNVSIDILSLQGSSNGTATHYIFNNLKITNIYNNNVKYENKHTLRSINSYTTNSSTTVDNYVIDVITQHIMNIKVITNKNNIYIKMYGGTEYASGDVAGFMGANILINKNDNVISFIHKSGQTSSGIGNFSDMYNCDYCDLFIDGTGGNHGNSKYTDSGVYPVSGSSYTSNSCTTFGGATTDNQMGLLYTGYKGIITSNSSTDIIIGDVKCLVGTADTNDLYYIHSLPGVYDCTTVTPETYYRLSTGVGNQTKLYYAIASNTLMEVDET